MGLLEAAAEKLTAMIETSDLDPSIPVVITPLSPDDAIGERAVGDFVIRKGKEVVIEARLDGAIGQAFTDQPSSWEGTVGDAMALDLSHVKQRALFTAFLNAALKRLGSVSGTIHCRNEEPTQCGPVLAEEMEKRFGRKRIVMVGLQPAILKGLAERFGPESISVVDLNPDNIGQLKSGVRVGDGESDLPLFIGKADVGLVTGSSIVNGTADEILRLFRESGKPSILFGNTIAGVAALLGLERICPFAG